MQKKHRRRSVWFVTTALALACIIATPAKQKEKRWQTGKLVDTNKSTFYTQSAQTKIRGKTDSSGNVRGTATTEAVKNTIFSVTIEAAGYMYIASRPNSFWLGKDPSLLLIVNDSIQFAIADGALYLRDQQGKEQKFSIDKVMKRE